MCDKYYSRTYQKSTGDVTNQTQSSLLKAGPVTLYAQLAEILRRKIVAGVWAYGDPIPTLEELAEEYEVARVTARQAIQMLSAEGLLSSHRGRRTTVTYDAKTQPVFMSVGSVERDTPDFRLRVFSSEPGMPAREDLFFGRLSDAYWLISKADMDAGSTYSVSQNFIARKLFDRFPEGAIERIKVARLVSEYGRDMVSVWKEKVTVGMSDEDESRLLGCALLTPVARITRICADVEGTVLYVGKLTYLGSRYETQRDITHLMK